MMFECTEKSKFREYLAKPALTRRRDETHSLFELTMAAVGEKNATEEMAVHSPFPDFGPGFKERYWATEMWSKQPFEIGIDRHAAAVASFVEGEASCASANSRLCDGFNRSWPATIREPLMRARRLLCHLLSDITLDEVVQLAGWGPGASTSLSRSKCSHQHKWEFATHATLSALPLVVAYFRYLNLNLMQSVEIVRGNRLTTVPKNAKTDRMIAIEPDWNMFFQKGLGRAIRRRLNKVGLLYKDAQDRNKSLARTGSLFNSYCTLDLRGASDGVSMALCELLLPQNVVDLLMMLRSSQGDLDGSVVTYEKISSMGNGATFELETALFYAVCSSVSEGGRAVVYGDDIIVPNSTSAERSTELLEFCGFTLNRKKSFLTGPFRESCGGHYYEGTDVTPPYFRQPIDSLRQYITAGNGISRRLNWRNPHDLAAFGDAWRLIAKSVPKRFRGPVSAGDVCLWAPFDATTPLYHTKWQSFVGQGIRLARESGPAPSWGALQAALHGDTHVEEYSTPKGVEKICYWYADRWSYSAPNF